MAGPRMETARRARKQHDDARRPVVERARCAFHALQTSKAYARLVAETTGERGEMREESASNVHKRRARQAPTRVCRRRAPVRPTHAPGENSGEHKTRAASAARRAQCLRRILSKT
ncbi:hypothetical protein BN2476_170101 [Paraburkholderia piptadeniae]|uniref:Uncharacterized protein n=1 Tax=Paraburkholderia piptadeniae TaxID=1701573 RepID=A0A1N7RTC8_9BURK|nr:hypothetical protein BN2476_170101 [Paraburkholderia piptadeniae]